MKEEVDIPGFTETDCEALGLLSKSWADEITAVVSRDAGPAVLEGGTSTSLEPAGSHIRYRLLDGVGIHRELPWLEALYRHELLDLATEAAGHQMYPAE